MASQFESAAELDKALKDGSFEEIKIPQAEVLEKRENELPELTEKEKADWAGVVSIAELSQAYKVLQDEAREAGLEAIAREAGIRSNDMMLLPDQVDSTSGEGHDLRMEHLHRQLEEFRRGLANTIRNKEAAAREDRVEDAREEVNDILEATHPESVVEVPTPRVDTAPQDELKLVDTSELTTQKQVQDKLKELLKSSTSRSEKKNIKATLKTFNRQYKEIGKQKRDGSMEAFKDRQRQRDEAIAAAAQKVQGFTLFR